MDGEIGPQTWARLYYWTTQPLPYHSNYGKNGYPEARLLAAGVGFLLVGLGVCAAIDQRSQLRSGS